MEKVSNRVSQGYLTTADLGHDHFMTTINSEGSETKQEAAVLAK